MRKIYTLLAAVLLTGSVFAQSPGKMSYQAVIRNSSNALVPNVQIGMQISILQGSANGTAVYAETQTPTTNANGLVSLEIGAGTVVSGNFTTIDWANGPYFIKTETDPTGGTTYIITGTSQLLSVPYALHAKTAESISGGLNETDPLFGASVASAITATDTTNWNNKLDSESDPVFDAWDRSTGISITESQISNLDHFSTADETDPVYGLSVAGGITATDTTNWNDKLDSESDPVFGAWDRSTGISITESQISNLDHFTTADETDPVYGTSVASGITATDTTNWNDKLDNESDPVFGAWDKSAGISITESQISDLGAYIETETDPSVPAGTQTGQMQYWNGSAWVTVAAGTTGQKLTNLNGIPLWIDHDANIDPVSGQIWKDVTSVTGEVWMDRNIGAAQVATSMGDAASLGDLYQWGRCTDGHQLRTSGWSSTLSGTDVPGHGDFIVTPNAPYDWRSPENTSLWQGVNGINNPCPAGYRLPTEAEMTAESATWATSDVSGAFNSPLKLPAAGMRYSFGNTGPVDAGVYGGYWTSTVDGSDSKHIVVTSTYIQMMSNYRSKGLSVRCIKD